MPSIKDVLNKHDGIVAVVGPSRKKRLQRPDHSEFEKYLVIVINGNALVQFVADLVLEVLHIIPTRVNHLSLTFLNAFIAFKTLSAVRKGKFQFLHEDCQFLFLMELCLIVGDVFYMLYDEFDPLFLYVRLAFIVCSLFNVIAVGHIIWKYKFFSIGYVGHKERRTSMTRMALRTVVSLWKERSTKVGVLLQSQSGDSADGVPVTAPVPEAESESMHGHPIFGKDFGGQSDSEDEEDPSKKESPVTEGDNIEARESKQDDTENLSGGKGKSRQDSYQPGNGGEPPSVDVVDLV